MRRVCVVGSGWHFLSGISFHTCRTANALAQRYDVSAILMRKLLPARLYPGAARVGQALTNLRYRDEVHVTDGVDYYWLPGLVRALLHLRRTRPEVVLFQWWSGTVLHTYLILAACTRLLGGKVLIEFHEVLDTAEAAHPWFSRYVNLFTRPLIAMTDGGVIHSEFDRQPVLDRFRLGDRPLVVVPVGSYDHFGEQDPSDVDSAPGGVCRLLYFGTIRPYKGLEHLVQVFNALTADEAARFHLTVVGETWEGWHRPLDMIEVSPHRDRITLVNRYVHDDEVAAFFRQADAVVLPYLRSSASGPLHIAMSFGLPVAVTRVGGLAEAAAEYEGARMVEPGSLTDLRAALMDLPTLAGTRYPDPHSWDANAERLAGLFDIVTGRPAAPDPAISG